MLSCAGWWRKKWAWKNCVGRDIIKTLEWRVPWSSCNAWRKPLYRQLVHSEWIASSELALEAIPPTRVAGGQTYRTSGLGIPRANDSVGPSDRSARASTSDRSARTFSLYFLSRTRPLPPTGPVKNQKKPSIKQKKKSQFFLLWLIKAQFVLFYQKNAIIYKKQKNDISKRYFSILYFCHGKSQYHAYVSSIKLFAMAT